MGLIELQPNEPFVFMKVGRHAGEDLDEILERKRRELDRAGMIFWGYGGGTMHPIDKVQPFIRSKIDQTGPLKLLMQSIVSKHPDTAAVATEYSKDGVHWESVPEGIEVRGSRYALVLGEIEAGDGEDLDLNAYQVGAGPSAGKSAGGYIKGRVDKGLLVPAQEGLQAGGSRIVTVDYAAQLKEPYAVLLRST